MKPRKETLSKEMQEMCVNRVSGTGWVGGEGERKLQGFVQLMGRGEKRSQQRSQRMMSPGEIRRET